MGFARFIGVRLSDKKAANHQESNSSNSPYGLLMREESKIEPERTNTPPQVPSNLLALLGGGTKASQAPPPADQNGCVFF